MLCKKLPLKSFVFSVIIASSLSVLSSNSMAQALSNSASTTPTQLSGEDQQKWDEYVKTSGLDAVSLYRLVALYSNPMDLYKNDVYKKHITFLIDLFEGKVHNPKSPAPELQTRTPIKSIDLQHWDKEKIALVKAHMRPSIGKKSVSVDDQILHLLNQYIQLSDSDRLKKVAENKLILMTLNNQWPHDKYPFLAFKSGKLRPFNDNDIEVSYEGGGPEGQITFIPKFEMYTVKQGEKISIPKGTVSALFFNPVNPYTGQANEELIKNPKKQLQVSFVSRVPGEDSKSLLVNMVLKADVKKIIFKPANKTTVE